jgi:H+/Cl- antiporter ClcA
MKNRTASNSVLYTIALVVIIVAFLLLGGGPWFNDIVHGSRLHFMAGWHWVEILISSCLGFLLGMVVTKKNW